jgi:hypothetical protein
VAPRGHILQVVAKQHIISTHTDDEIIHTTMILRKSGANATRAILVCCENDRLRNNTGATFSSWEEDVAKLCCLFLINGNRISQQRFIARRSRPSGRNLSSN